MAALCAGVEDRQTWELRAAVEACHPLQGAVSGAIDRTTLASLAIDDIIALTVAAAVPAVFRTFKTILSPLPLALRVSATVSTVKGAEVAVFFRTIAELVPARQRAIRWACQGVFAQQGVADPVAAIGVAVLRTY